MRAVQVRQKDGVFYFVNYPAEKLLDKVRFISRYYYEGEQVEEEKQPKDEIAQFIARIEKSDRAFQRALSRRKVASIVNFYETAGAQPIIPGTILLVTESFLDFKPVGQDGNFGDLEEPPGKFLVIDGQHRLAALYFYSLKHPEEIGMIQVPTIIFDGKSSDFTAEMFVIINSTQTKINRSHLVDLMERVTFGTNPYKKFAAGIVAHLYTDGISPLQYKINRLGGRSKQEKWILQSELYNEVLKVVERHKKMFEKRFLLRADRGADLFADYLRAVRRTMYEIWGNKLFMFCNSVTLKALIRVLNDLLDNRSLIDRWEEEGEEAFMPLLDPWRALAPRFRTDGFYERFPAKGQIERVRRIHQELKAAIQPQGV